MQLNEVLTEIKPAAQVMLRRGMTLQQASKAICLTYALVNVEHWGTLKIAAENLGVSESYLSKILSGKAKFGSSPRSPRIQTDQAEKLVGAVEL